MYISIPHIALTRVCVTAMSKGVPFGTHTAWLLATTNGSPFDVTRVLPTVHCPVTQGIGFVPGVNGQPATEYGGGNVTVG